MSTVAYAQLTNAREAAKPGTSSTTSNPGIKSYIDTFTALVPAEVLTLHAFIIAVTTKTATTTSSAGTVSAANATTAVAAEMGITTTILPEAVETLTVMFWVMVVLSILLFIIPRYIGGKWDRFDWLRAVIAPLAFVGWTMLQHATAFDAAFPNVNHMNRTVYALILGVVLGSISAALASVADAKSTKPSPIPAGVSQDQAEHVLGSK